MLGINFKIKTMKKTITLSIIFLLLANLQSFSQQDYIHCATDEMRITHLKQNPKIAQAVIKRDEALEKFTKSFIDNYQTKASMLRSTSRTSVSGAQQAT